MNIVEWFNGLADHTKKNIKNVIIGSIGGGFLTLLSYFVADLLGWADFTHINPLEAFAVFTSYLCTWLCSQQTRWNYPVGIITTLAYSILFWQFELYALALFNGYLVLSLAYGFWRWGDDKDTRPVTKVKGWWHLGYVGLAIVVYLLLAIIHAVMGQEMGPVDVILAVASGVAQFLLDNKKLENWLVWIVINVVSIPFYISQELYIVAFQYVFFLAHAVYGYIEWKKHLRPEKEIDFFDDSFKDLTFPDTPRVPQQMAAFT